MTAIEKVARALCDDAGCVWDMDPQSLSRAEWRKAARAAIAAMQEPVALHGSDERRAQDHFRNATRLAARAALGEPQ